MDFQSKVQACRYLVDQNPNMGLGEIREFVIKCMAIGAREAAQARDIYEWAAAQWGCDRAAAKARIMAQAYTNPGRRACDVSSVPIESGD